MQGEAAVPDLLDRLYEEALSRGQPLSIAEAAPRYLKTENALAAGQVLAALLVRDSRFLVEGDRLTAAPPRNPFRGLALSELHFAVLDFETNGMTPRDRAIEVGVICVDGDRLGESFETLLDPGTPVSPFVERLTGISSRDLVGRPSFAEVWPGLEALLAGRVLVAHNLPFDRRILRREVALLGGDPLTGIHGLCTVRLSRRLFPSEESHCLDAVAERFGLGFGARHRALGDAEVTAKVLLRLLKELEEREGIITWDGLQEWLIPARPKRSLRPRGTGGKSTGRKGGTRGVPGA